MAFPLYCSKNEMEIPKLYTPAESEAPWYPLWENRGYFTPKLGPGPSYSIVIPPPNVTGSLHMGHALNNTLQDILTRLHRMQGDRTVWVPGTDHGGIATQNVVEKLLRAEGKTRQDLGRDAFLERMWKWRQESGDTILMQLRRLGASCDWTRTRFTMDEECSRAVRRAFVELFKMGLIYRGPRMVNWCPRCHTALADIEVEHEERAGKLWHIKYPLGPKGQSYIEVATTRPETMLGDTAVAVNPDDERYKGLIGKTLQLPLTDRQIPIVADAAVDASFGTGAVKVTPAHDPTDFEIGERHGLPHVVVINFEGKMTDAAGAYAGLDRFEARKRVVADLEAQGWLNKTEDYRLSAATCYRCSTIIEPLVSEQWFLKMKGMAERAAAATRDGQMKIFPSSWERPYLNWLDNIKDWCISRQIWWGHRIPVWYCRSSLKTCPPIASEEPPKGCPQCGSTELSQDEDVLDTWFSSGLWPLSVFGWPDETEDLKTFYPTSVLVTGHEILYLWVARMVMLGLQFRNDVPFRHVYIHGIVRDKQGKKMSKSLGNVIDPLEIMKQFGTDALRLAMASSSIPGRDMQMSNDSFLKARNFANKLWNASRFVQMNLENYTPQALPPVKDRTLADRWILHDLQATISAVTEALGSYNPAEASRLLYEFVWNSYCDWYLEISKTVLMDPQSPSRAAKQTVLVEVLQTALRLLHPIMPYETEHLYQALRPFMQESTESVMIAPWPLVDPQFSDPVSAQKMLLVQNVVEAIRRLRSESQISPAVKVDCYIQCTDPRFAGLFGDLEVRASILFLSKIETLASTAPQEYLFTVFDGGEIYISAQGLVDKEKERARLKKNYAQLEQTTARAEQILKDENFLSHAPKEEIDRIRETLRQGRQKMEWIQKNLQGLS